RLPAAADQGVGLPRLPVLSVSRQPYRRLARTDARPLAAPDACIMAANVHHRPPFMKSLICGSLAFDTIMLFEGRFSEALLADQLHKINVSFLVPGLRREFGGCAGNIAYNLKLLGGEPLIMATIGQDGEPYR